VTRRWYVTSAPANASGEGFLALAGAGLWVSGGDRLLRLSLPDGRVTASIVLRGETSSDIGADPAGTVLVVGEADDGGEGRIERRDPVTGRLLAVSPPILGVGTPVVGAVIDGGAWISEATGNMGYVQLYDLSTLTPRGNTCQEGVSTETCFEGSNGIDGRLANGLLWVTQGAGGPTRNFCGNSADGRASAVIPVAPDEEVLAIGADTIYLVAATPGGRGSTITEEPIPAACRSG
jgi:hypothetical protein